MSLIIALILVLVVATLITKFYPTSKKTELIEEQPIWNFDNHIDELAPESTPEPSILAAISEKEVKEDKKSKKKPVSKNTAKVKPLAKMEAKKKKPTKK